MVDLIKSLTERIIKNPEDAFLMDGLGALLSAILLVFLIAPLESVFGLHKSIALNLSIPVFGFTVFSLSCYFLKLKNWKPFLLLIAIANGIYCCVTMGIMMWHFHSFKALGIIYFFLEIVVIITIIAIELSLIRKHHHS